MRRDRRALGIALALALAACSEDPVPKLEAEKKALLESTRPKAEFWSEVERKGELFKQKKAIDAELADVQQKTGAIQPELQQLGAAVAGAGEANARAEQVLAEQRAELARIEGEVAKREATLAGFDRRRSEGP